MCYWSLLIYVFWPVLGGSETIFCRSAKIWRKQREQKRHFLRDPKQQRRLTGKAGRSHPPSFQVRSFHHIISRKTIQNTPSQQHPVFSNTGKLWGGFHFLFLYNFFYNTFFFQFKNSFSFSCQSRSIFFLCFFSKSFNTFFFKVK